MTSKETLKEQIEKLRFNGDTRTDAEVLRNHVDGELAVYKNFVADGTRTNAETLAAIAPVKDVCGLYNDLMRWQRLDVLATLKPKDAFKEMLSTQCVTGVKVGNNKDSGVEIQKADVAISAYDFYKELFSLERQTIEDMCCIFADNVAKFVMGDDDVHITKDSMHQTYVKMRNDRGWNLSADEMTYSCLARQLSEVAKVISFGTCDKMINADVKYVQYGTIGTKDQANKEGSFVTRNESTIINLIFRAIYTRVNGKAYGFQVQTGATKAAQTVKANTAMAESGKNAEFAKNATPDAGPVEVVEPKPKKAKKGTKKSAKEEAAAK